MLSAKSSALDDDHLNVKLSLRHGMRVPRPHPVLQKQYKKNSLKLSDRQSVFIELDLEAMQ